MSGRKKTPRFILWVMAMAFLLASCYAVRQQTGGGEPWKDTDGIEAHNSELADKSALDGYPDVLKITRCLYFGDSSENAGLKEAFMKEFHEKTGIRLQVTYPPRTN